MADIQKSRVESEHPWPPGFNQVAFRQAEADFEEVANALESDLVRAAKEADWNSADQFHRRALVRALFAYVEAILFHMKRMTLLGDPFFLTENLSDAEKAALSETSFIVTRTGEVKERDQRVPLRNNIRLSFRYYCPLFTPGWSPDFEAPEWSDLLNAIAVRDRVTHPKTAVSIHIGDEEHTTVMRAQTWWRETIHRLVLELRKRGGST